MQRAIVIRYGGFGDALQAASILPGLKEQGWDITLDCSEQGFELLKSDPCIDALLLTPQGSVDLADLGEYWNARTNGFNRVINLCQSVENAHLMLPSALGFFHDDETRRRLYGGANYVEHIHRIAGVPGPFLPRFCPTMAEIEDAKALLAVKSGEKPRKTAILALAGSSEYKIWPHADDFVSLLLDQTDALIFLAGGPKDAVLAEKVLENVASRGEMAKKRVIDATSWPVRASYTLACLADWVVGPETGMLNAAAASFGRKVVLLSHSTPTNLTKHWINTISVAPGVPCHPCHRLHQSTKFCPRGPSGAFAACAESIDPALVLEACQISSEAQ